MCRRNAVGSQFMRGLDAVGRRSVFRRSVCSGTSCTIQSAIARFRMGHCSELLSGMERPGMERPSLLSRTRVEQTRTAPLNKSGSETAAADRTAATETVRPTAWSKHHIRRWWQRKRQRHPEPSGRRRRRTPLIPINKQEREAYRLRALVCLSGRCYFTSQVSPARIISRRVSNPFEALTFITWASISSLYTGDCTSRITPTASGRS